MRLPWLLVASSCLVWSGCKPPPVPEREALIQPRGPVKASIALDDLEKVEFGSTSKVDGEEVFRPHAVVTRGDGEGYGWRLHMSPDRVRRVEIKEVLRLPVAPKQWGVSQATRISRDRRTATTTMARFPRVDGTITSEWTYTKEDPVGQYTLMLYVDEQYVTTHVFEVK